MKKKGIHIKEENEGKFGAFARSVGMGVQEAARHVLANKDRYSASRVKQANFAKNAAGWRKQDGGTVGRDDGWQMSDNHVEAGMRFQEGGQKKNYYLNDPVVDSVLNANKQLNFVDRYLYPKKYPVLARNDDGSESTKMTYDENKGYSTHSMMSTDNLALPTVVQLPDGSLQRLEPKDAINYALKTGEFIRFKTDADADKFAANGYKRGMRYWQDGGETEVGGLRLPVAGASSGKIGFYGVPSFISSGLAATKMPCKECGGGLPRAARGGSIVDFLGSQGVDPSFSNRKQLFGEHFNEHYKGSADQNTRLLALLQSGAQGTDDRGQMTDDSGGMPVAPVAVPAPVVNTAAAAGGDEALPFTPFFKTEDERAAYEQRLGDVANRALWWGDDSDFLKYTSYHPKADGNDCINGICGLNLRAGLQYSHPTDEDRYLGNTKFTDNLHKGMEDYYQTYQPRVGTHLQKLDDKGIPFHSMLVYKIDKDDKGKPTKYHVIHNGGDTKFMEKVFSPEDMQEELHPSDRKDPYMIAWNPGKYLDRDKLAKERMGKAPFPYNQSEEEVQRYFGDTNLPTRFSLKDDSNGLTPDSPLYYLSGRDVKDQSRNELLGYLNDKELDKELRGRLRIDDVTLQNLKPYIFGIMGVESNDQNISAGRDIKERVAQLVKRDPSLGPFQIRLGSVGDRARKAFDINEQDDLSKDLRKGYIAAVDRMLEAKRVMDDRVAKGYHPELAKADPYARATYYYNQPQRALMSDEDYAKKNFVYQPFTIPNPVGKDWRFSTGVNADQGDVAAAYQAFLEQSRLKGDRGSYMQQVMRAAYPLNMEVLDDEQPQFGIADAQLPAVEVVGKRPKRRRGGEQMTDDRWQMTDESGVIKVSRDGYKANSKDRFNEFNVIPSGRITMQGVPHPVVGMDNLGYGQVMMPGAEYRFPGQAVFEVPVRGMMTDDRGQMTGGRGPKRQMGGVVGGNTNNGGMGNGVVGENTNNGSIFNSQFSRGRPGRFQDGGAAYAKASVGESVIPAVNKTSRGPFDATEAQRREILLDMQSPKYRERLQREFGREDVGDELQARINNVRDARVAYNDGMPYDQWGMYVPKNYKGEVYDGPPGWNLEATVPYKPKGLVYQTGWKPNGPVADPYFHRNVPGTVYLEDVFRPGKKAPVEVAPTPGHELWHAADDGGFRIPDSTHDMIYNATDRKNDPVIYKRNGKVSSYLTRDSEVEARKHVADGLGRDAGIYDSRTQDFTPEMADKMIADPTIRNNSDFQEFYNSLKGDDAEKRQHFVELMNNIAYNPNGEGTMARYGGERTMEQGTRNSELRRDNSQFSILNSPFSMRRFQDGGVSYTAPEGYAPSTAEQRANWNQFLNYLDSKGVAGSADLDARDKRLGLQYLNEYNKAYPKTQVPESFIPTAQYENYLIRRKNEFPGLTGDEAKFAFANLPATYRERPISGVDNWIGAYTSKELYPGYTRGKTVRSNDGTEAAENYNFGQNFEDYVRSRSNAELERKYLTGSRGNMNIANKQGSQESTNELFNRMLQSYQLGGEEMAADRSGFVGAGNINPFNANPYFTQVYAPPAAPAPVAPMPAAAPSFSDTGLYPYGVINPFDVDPYTGGRPGGAVSGAAGTRPTNSPFKLQAYPGYNPVVGSVADMAPKIAPNTISSTVLAAGAKKTPQKTPPQKTTTQWGPNITAATGVVAGLSMLNSALESGDRNRYKQWERIRNLGDNNGVVLPGNLEERRGDYSLNEGYFRPQRYVPTQFGIAQMGGFFSAAREDVPVMAAPQIPTMPELEMNNRTGNRVVGENTNNGSQFSNGEGIDLRQEGKDIATKTNNPGNIKWHKGLEEMGGYNSGIKGTDGGTFAGFPSIEAGLAAYQTQLFGDVDGVQKSKYYKADTPVDKALRLWSNNGYGAEIFPEIKDKRLGDLTQAERDELMRRQIKRESGAMYRKLKEEEVFREGGEYEVSDEQLRQILANGGEVEYL